MTKAQEATNTLARLGNHVLFIFVGERRELVNNYSDLLPDPTKAYIAERSQGRAFYQLPEEAPDIVQMYRSFLYSCRIVSISEGDIERPDNGRTATHNDAEWTKLAHAYLFGVTVKDERFANAYISAIIENVTETLRFPSGIATEVYQFTQSGDNLRKLIVDLHVWSGKGTSIQRPREDADGPKEILQDVTGGLAAAGARFHDPDMQMPWTLDECAYHSHDGTGRCGG